MRNGQTCASLSCQNFSLFFSALREFSGFTDEQEGNGKRNKNDGRNSLINIFFTDNVASLVNKFRNATLFAQKLVVL